MAASKRKGSGYELELVRAHQRLGIDAEKMPLSGALGGEYSGDLRVAGLTCEAKRRAKAFKFLYDSLAQGGGSDVLFVRADHQPTLAFLPWDTWVLFLEWANLKGRYPANEFIDTSSGRR